MHRNVILLFVSLLAASCLAPVDVGNRSGASTCDADSSCSSSLPCTFGSDQTCNDGPALSSLLGSCTTAGCVCGIGSTLNETSHKCRALMCNEPGYTGLCRTTCVVTDGRGVCTDNERCRSGDSDGAVTVRSTGGSSQSVEIGSTATLRWSVDSQTPDPAIYRMFLDFSGVVGASADAWAAGAVLDPMGEITIARASPFAVEASLQVPNDARGIQVSLRVETIEGLIRATSTPLALRIGQPPSSSDPRFWLQLPALNGVARFNSDGANPIQIGLIDVGGGCVAGVKLIFHSTGDLPMTLITRSDAPPGDYRYSASIEGAPPEWGVDSIVPADGHLGVPGGSQRAIVLKVTQTGAAYTFNVDYLLIRAEHRPPGSMVTDFVSSLRVPLQLQHIE